jgi:hypothetical protein
MITHTVPTTGIDAIRLDKSGDWKLLRKKKLRGAPGTTRTCDLLIRSQTLYPTELRAHPFWLNKLLHRIEFRNRHFQPFRPSA